METPGLRNPGEKLRPSNTWWIRVTEERPADATVNGQSSYSGDSKNTGASRTVGKPPRIEQMWRRAPEPARLAACALPGTTGEVELPRSLGAQRIMSE